MRSTKTKTKEVPLEGIVQLVKMREKVGSLERVDNSDNRVYIVADLFKEDTDLSLFLKLQVVHENSGYVGFIEGAAGKVSSRSYTRTRAMGALSRARRGREGTIEGAAGKVGDYKVAGKVGDYRAQSRAAQSLTTKKSSRQLWSSMLPPPKVRNKNDSGPTILCVCGIFSGWGDRLP